MHDPAFSSTDVCCREGDPEATSRDSGSERHKQAVLAEEDAQGSGAAKDAQDDRPQEHSIGCGDAELGQGAGARASRRSPLGPRELTQQRPLLS